ncbi:MAG TPA: hypothetical protein VK828_02620 [Terriglobales bacterium]|jgi:hypothetical protein|nr:hypothetical protein [Terriglobales bacterium]
MLAIVAFHVLMILLGLGIISRALPVKSVANALSYVHKTIGITTPPMAQTRKIALIWIGSILILADGCLLLLVFIASSLH